MRKQLYREHRKMFFRVITALLILSIGIFAVFFYFMCNAERSQLLNNAENNFTSLEIRFSDNDLIDNETADFLINSNRPKNSEIIITDNDGAMLAKSENKLAISFYDKNYEKILSFIDFKKFRSSVTDEQYKNITALLKSRTDVVNGYLLLLTEFYISQDGKDILPKKVEIIPAALKDKEYRSENTVNEFILNPDIPTDYEFRKSGDKCDSIILTDFFCGGYANDGLIETAQDNNIVQTDMFTYIFCSQAKINGNISVIYAEQINVLDECYERILIMIIYICVLIIISAPFIWVISRRSVKYQIRLEHERRDYTNALAHDIKTPLFIIGGNAETLLEISQNQAQKECAQNVLDCSKSANRLVEDMLDFSAFDGDSYVLNRERINLNDLVSDLLKRYGASVTLEYNESIIINADRTFTERMLENLIDNAVKHTDDKNGIKITLHKNRFIIENHCKNLNEKDLCRIFEPYQTLSNSGGNGLGLSIVKTICNLHNFKCSVSLENYVIKFIVNF